MITHSYEVDCDGARPDEELCEATFRYEPAGSSWGDATGLVNQMKKRGWTTYADDAGRVLCYCPLHAGSVR